MKIICKTTLLPPERGTSIVINVTADSPSFGIYTATLADGHDAVVVNWGDGTCESHAGIAELSHTYAAPGRYTVTLSDDIASLGVSFTAAKPPFTTVYPSLIHTFSSNAANLNELTGGCCKGATNLGHFDLVDSAIATFGQACFLQCTSLTEIDNLPHGLTKIGTGAFSMCKGVTRFPALPASMTTLWGGSFGSMNSLSGRIDMPYVEEIRGFPFSSSQVGITEFHFAAAHEESICNSSGYLTDPTLGTGTAVCRFDL